MSPHDENNTDRADLTRKVAESRKRHAAQSRIFLDLVRRYLPTKMVYRPGVMRDEEYTRHLHGFATEFYASKTVREVAQGVDEFDEMYYLLQLASLATMIAVEAYDWSDFPELEGMLSGSYEDEELYTKGKETYSREEVLRAIARAREKAKEVEDAARFGEDLTGRVQDERGFEKAAAMKEVVDTLREALLLERE